MDALAEAGSASLYYLWLLVRSEAREDCVVIHAPGAFGSDEAEHRERLLELGWIEVERQGDNLQVRLPDVVRRWGPF